MRDQYWQTLQAATAEVRLDPAKSADFSGSVVSNARLLPLYRQQVRFTIAHTRQRGDFAPKIAGKRANVSLCRVPDSGSPGPKILLCVIQFTLTGRA